MLYSQRAKNERGPELIGSALLHAFVVVQTIRKIANIEEGRFSFLHIGARAEVERIFYNAQAPDRLFSTEDETWLRHFFSNQPHHAGLAYNELIKAPGGMLVLERFRLLAEHCPGDPSETLQPCLKHFLLWAVPRLRRSIEQSWITAGRLASTYFGARMKTITEAEF